MNISSISLRCFTSHDSTELVLPERGVVVIVGPNGGGKSSIAEAVSVAAFGKSLRGTAPWREDTAGHVEMLFDGCYVRRAAAKGGRIGLEWSQSAACVAVTSAVRLGGWAAADLFKKQNPGVLVPATYETTTKAQEALARVVGSFDVWRRSHVFSAADAHHFSGATDGERKRLLESVLGIEKFDAALDACRADLKMIEKRFGKASADSAGAESARQAAMTGLSKLEIALEALEAPAGLLDGSEMAITAAYKLGGEAAVRSAVSIEDTADEVRKLSKYRAQAAKAIKSARLALSGLSSIGGEHEAERRQLERQLRGLEADACSACGQSIPEALRARLRVLVDRATQEAVAAQTAAKGEREGLEAELAELEEEHRNFEAAIHALNITAQRREDATHEAEKYAKQRDLLERAVVSARQDVGHYAAQAVEHHALAQAAEAELAVVTACEKVLGLNGVRANVLGRALGGIEQVANGWLARLRRPDLRVKLRPYTEKKSGGVSDSISLGVEGAGAGLGYRAMSGGERRRVDLALLLALGEVAGAARGMVTGTIFLDEALDALDRDGVDAAVDAVKELATVRAVVVITHNEELARKLDAVMRLRIEGGKVTQN